MNSQNPHPVPGTRPTAQPPGDRPPQPRVTGGSRSTKLATAAAAFATLLGGGACDVFGSHGTPAPRIERLSEAQANPFTPPVGKDNAAITPVAGGGGVRDGSTQGLFAQDPNQPSCDAQSLISALLADPGKSQAWAQVEGINPDLIPSFVNSLIPVVLRSNTGVTDHGYANNTFTSFPAVLPAGTATFINSYGEPTVRCFTGDPLTPPVTSTSGGGQTGITDPAVTIVQPAARVIERHTFLNVNDNSPVTVIGKPDPKPNKGSNPHTNQQGGNQNGQNAQQGSPLPLGAIYNYDGTILIPNGQLGYTLLNPDSTIKGSGGGGLPRGVTVTKRNPDGSTTLSNGTVLNANGSIRKPVTLPNGATLNPDGITTPKVDPAPIYNYDGTVLIPSGQLGYTLLNPDSTIKGSGGGGLPRGVTVTKRNPDGSTTLSNGTVLNANGSIRKPVILPNGGGTLSPDGMVNPTDAAMAKLAAATATQDATDARAKATTAKKAADDADAALTAAKKDVQDKEEAQRLAWKAVSAAEGDVQAAQLAIDQAQSLMYLYRQTHPQGNCLGCAKTPYDAALAKAQSDLKNAQAKQAAAIQATSDAGTQVGAAMQARDKATTDQAAAGAAARAADDAATKAEDIASQADQNAKAAQAKADQVAGRTTAGNPANGGNGGNNPGKKDTGGQGNQNGNPAGGPNQQLAPGNPAPPLTGDNKPGAGTTGTGSGGAGQHTSLTTPAKPSTSNGH